MTPEEFQVVRLSLWVAAWAACLVLPVAVVVGLFLSGPRRSGQATLETVVMLPLVLPPVATGYFLLVLFSPNGWLGGRLSALGLSVVLDWKGAVLAATLVALPLAVQVVKVALGQVGREWQEVAEVLGATPGLVFWTVTLPLARRGLVAAWVLAFARALGEFGATILVAGNIPGATQTLPSALFSAIETGHDQAALRLVVLACFIAMGALLVVRRMTR